MADDPRAIATADDPRFGGRRPLLDMNEDGRISFADTFLGDLLGFDGRAGAQGPGMMASMGGARRQRAMQMMQEQGVPMTEQNLQRVMTQMPSDGAESGPTRPQMRPQTAAPAEMGPNAPAPASAPAPANGDPAVDVESDNVVDAAGVPASLAALGVTAAMLRRMNRTGTTGDPAMDIEVSRVLNGEVLDPERAPDPSRLRGASRVAAIEAARGSDVTVTPNPPRTDNALPAPAPNAPSQTAQPTDNGLTLPRQAPNGGEQAILDYLDSVDAAPDAQPTASPRTTAPPAPNAADAPISAEEVMNTAQPLPEGVREAPEYTQPSQATTRVDTGQRGPNGEMVFRDPNSREFVASVQNGRTIAAPTLDALMSALRAIR